jgi:outer membrane lipoprotein
MAKKILLVIILLTLTTGCAHVISKEVRREVDPGVTFEMLRRDPSAFRGKVVLLGGVIVSAVNEKDGTLLELYQTRMDGMGTPIDVDRSSGRFLALYKGFLDGEIYRKGRRMTIAGVAEGEKVKRLGDIDYRYPYLVVKEIHLWKEEPVRRYDPFYDPWGPRWWGPWGPWGPWDPWWGPYPYRHPYW